MAHRPSLLVWRALARLLCYPDAALRAILPELRELLQAQQALTAPRRAGLLALVDELHRGEPLAVEAAYVELFDRGRSTSLHLFEHVHGESRERGAAMVDLGAMYAAAGLHLAEGELPDFLPAALEFVSTQSQEVARGFIGEMAHILNALHTALAERRSRYAEVIAAALELAGEAVQRVEVPPDEALDAAWEEPPAFAGCSTRGQARPGEAQPVHIVRPARTPAQGASA